PVFLHLVRIGRGIGAGPLRVKPLTRHPRQRDSGSRDHHCRSQCMAHSRPPLSISTSNSVQTLPPQRSAAFHKPIHAPQQTTSCMGWLSRLLVGAGKQRLRTVPQRCYELGFSPLLKSAFCQSYLPTPWTSRN